MKKNFAFLIILALISLGLNSFNPNEAKANSGKVIDISISDQQMTVIENYRVINRFAVSTGTWDMPTPYGTFYVQNHIYDAYSQPYDLYMPFWMGIGGGYGIHGLPYWKYSWGNVYEGVNHLGLRVSHGCIRLSVANAEWLYNWAPNGTQVIIHGESGVQATIVPPDYAGEIIDQSPKNITVKPGETFPVWFKVKNTGKHWWYNVGSHPINIGTENPRDRHSEFFNQSWLSTNRVTKMAGTGIENGQEITFTLSLTAPDENGYYEEFFRPVAEGHSWFEDAEVSWNITVYQPEYSCEWVSQTAYPIYTYGHETYPMEITFRNTGSKTWYNHGTYPVRLATSHIQDRSSLFYDQDSWISDNRVVTMNESEVEPGETATFSFAIKSPNLDGTFKEYFQLVTEGKTWMEDRGVYWIFDSHMAPTTYGG